MKQARSQNSGYTLIEVMVGVCVLGIAVTSLYGGFVNGFGMMETTRENLRASQIMEERMETIRLYTWNQVTNTGFISTSFTNSYYPDGITTGTSGITYTGSITVVKLATNLPSTYRDNMRQVNVQVGWMSRNVPRERSMQTFVARYGIQNYIYSPTNSF
jgi:prepilin-type N-terminal cleavage/methylation domain-containing protein